MRGTVLQRLRSPPYCSRALTHRHVRDSVRGADHRVHQARVVVDVGVRFHAGVLLVALPEVMR
jgi:hypothetical protein